MSTIIQIKRSTGTSAPSTLKLGELAYTYGTGTQGNLGDRLFIGEGGVDGDGNANNITVIGGEYFTNQLDHAQGTLTASSALLVDSNKAIDEIFIGNALATGGTLKLNEGTNNGTNFIGLKAPNAVTTTTTFTLPDGDGSNGQFLKTDGSGNLSFGTVSSTITLAADSGSDDTYTTGNTLTFTGGTGIDTTVSDDTITIAVDATVATASSTTTFTNKTFDANGTGNSISNIEVADLASGVLDTDLSTVSASDDTLASAKAIKAYVDSQVTSIDVDIAADTGTIAITDAETLTFTGGTAIETSATGNAVTFAVSDGGIDTTQLATDAVTTAKITDGNVTNAKLANSTITIRDDSSTEDSISLGETLIVSGGTGITSTVGTNEITLNIDSTVATLTGSQTLTNKTLTSPVISTISNTGTLTLPTSTDTLVGRDTTDTLTNKVIDTANNTITIVEADISDLGSYITASSTDTLTNKTFDANGTGNSISNIEVADLASGVLDTDLSSVSASDDTLASAKAIKAYIDSENASQMTTFTIFVDSSTTSTITQSDTLQFLGGTGIGSTVSGDTVTFAIDNTVTTNSGTQTLTNKTIDSASNTLTLDLGEGTLTGTTAEFNSALSDGSFATLAGTEALSNKTINSASNTITVVEADISDLQSYILADSSDTLQNKGIDLANNTLTGTTAEFNTALSDGSFATLAGTETLSNKTLT